MSMASPYFKKAPLRKAFEWLWLLIGWQLGRHPFILYVCWRPCFGLGFEHCRAAPRVATWLQIGSLRASPTISGNKSDLWIMAKSFLWIQ